MTNEQREKILAAKFVQIVVMPATADFHGSALHALDEAGRVWDYDGTHKVWTPLSTNRALPEDW